MKTWTAVLISVGVALSGCGPRVLLSTATTLGLKATPGDGSTRPPQVTFGYKRAEASVVPTKGTTAKNNEDAYSTLAAFHFSTMFFGTTELDSFISTGKAAIDIQQPGSEFTEQVKMAVQAFNDFRANNRAQLAAAQRITGTYAALADSAKRKRIRDKAIELKLVPLTTTDEEFKNFKLQDAAIGGLLPVTQRFQELEQFAADVVSD